MIYLLAVYIEYKEPRENISCTLTTIQDMVTLNANFESFMAFVLETEGTPDMRCHRIYFGDQTSSAHNSIFVRQNVTRKRATQT